MTTIAYKDGLVAYDSRAMRGEFILTDEADKKIETEDNLFFMSGSVDEFEAFINLYEKCEQPTHKLDIVAFVFNKTEKRLFHTACWKTDEDLYLCHRTKVDCHQSIGSGASFAYTAMDCGKSSYEAVEMAKKRDGKTGGKVNTFSIQDAQEKEQVKKNIDINR